MAAGASCISSWSGCRRRTATTAAAQTQVSSLLAAGSSPGAYMGWHSCSRMQAAAYQLFDCPTWPTTLTLLNKHASVASVALIGMFLYELITQKDFVYATFPYVKSVIHLIMLIQVFLHPEILYGPQRVPLPVLEADEPNGFKPAFNWHTSPKEIKNKLDLELSEKFNSRINEIIRKLESKAAIQLIIRLI